MAPTFQKFVLMGIVSCLGIACSTDDTGRVCESLPTSIGSEPVVGEAATAEIAKLSRDESCQSLQCLSEAGLPAYCTRTCELTEETTALVSCDTDAECASPTYCLDGHCRDDDCPAGFWCRSPFVVGPLSESPLCVRRKDCTSNIDCEGLGRITCVALGCIDQCLLDPDTCTEHSLLCQDRESLPCTCPEELGDACSTSELECTLPSASSPLPADAVLHRNVCIQDQPPS